MAKDRENIPLAPTLMGSLRFMGYSFESAVADVIDNSITAQANAIQILFPSVPTDAMAVGIMDNGNGMTSDEIYEAMRYGSTAVEDERSEQDLGRFGMGLKSASLSQCRNLTVVSYKDGVCSAYRWDYNYIIKTQKWIVQELTDQEITDLPYSKKFDQQKKGTLVLWQDFDVISKSSNGQVFSTLNSFMGGLEKYLALIFHRYLSGTLDIKINNQKIDPLDPFLEYHKKTMHKKEIDIAIPDTNGVERHIRVKPYILPYATNLTDKDKKLIGGIENLRPKQGFYVYRNGRLIIWGTWFGMKPRAELTKNARIRVDIPNTLDDIWGIDIKKQTAVIPKPIQNQLKRTVEDALELSENQQKYRGRRAKVNFDIDYIWDRKEGRGSTFFYEINRNSKLFQFVKDQMTEEDFGYLDMLITEIEKNIPIQQMYIDKSNEAISIEDSENRVDEVFQIAITLVEMLKKVNNRPYNDIIEDLMKSEPFCKYEQVKENLIKNYKDK